MISDSFIRFVETLTKKNAGKAIWNTTSMLGQYKIVLKDSTVTIYKKSGFLDNNSNKMPSERIKEDNDEEMVISIYGFQGSRESSVFNSTENKEEFTLLNTLYESVQKYCKNEVEEMYNHLLEQIKGEGVIGHSSIDS